MRIITLACLAYFPIVCFCQTNYDSIRVEHAGMIAIKKGSSWGYLNHTGQQKIPFRYLQASDFIEAFAVVFDGAWHMIDSNGVILKDVDTHYAARFFHGAKQEPTGTAVHIQPASFTRQGTQVANIAGQCPQNIDFENGNFSNWYCYTGRVSTVGTTNVITFFNNNPPVNSPVNQRHTLISRTTTSALDYYGRFPINPPDGSGFAVRLGNDEIRDSAEKIRYVVSVPANAADFSISFQYAVVLENPTSGHSDAEKPRMIAQVVDAVSGQVVQCADFLYVAAGTIPGFYNSTIDPNVKCKSWTPVFVNLSAYAGRTLYIDFTTADCTLGAHFGYAYVDVGPCSEAIKMTYNCNVPHMTSLTGPPGFQQYKWWDNNFTTMLGTSQNLTLNPGPALNTMIWLELIPFNGIACKDTLGVKILQNFPTANAGPDRAFCNSLSAPIGMPPVNSVIYSWSPTNGLSNPGISNPVASPAASVDYYLTATDTSGCINRDTVKITVYPKPVARFQPLQANQCLSDNSYTFNNLTTLASGTYSSQWYFGDGGSATTFSPAHQYAAAGTYMVRLITTTDKGCIDSFRLSVTVYPKPAVSFTVNSPIQCTNENNLVYTNGSSVTPGSISYYWQFGDGAISTVQHPSHHYTSPGTYYVKLIVTSDKGCRDSLIKQVIINPNPGVNISGNDQVDQCRGNSTQLHATGGDSYLWSPQQDLTCSACPDPVASPLTNMDYAVTGINSYGCKGYDTVHLRVIQPFSVRVSNDTICRGDTAHLLATGAPRYTWSPRIFLSSTTIPGPAAYPVETIQYQVVGYDDEHCFTDTAYMSVVVGQPLAIDLGPDLHLATGDRPMLTAQVQNGPVRVWTWTPATNLSCSVCPSPVANVKRNITYALYARDIYGCVASDSLRIESFCEQSQVFVPNAFTPDGDGLNDIMMVRGKGIMTINFFRVFNRWGELVFERYNFAPNDPKNGWDGRIRGVKAPPDVFVYIVEAVCENGANYQFKGNISIIK